MKRLDQILALLVLSLLIFFGAWSLLDRDETIAPAENRRLHSMPEFSWSALTDGSFSADLEAYYADTFPLRTTFLSVSRTLNGLYTLPVANVPLIIAHENNAASAGQLVNAPIEELPEPTVTQAGTVILMDGIAMDIPTCEPEVLATYAAAVNNISQSLGVPIYSLLVPNSGAFYSPESYHTGVHDQAAMIAECYDAMGDSICTVDVFSTLDEHAKEEIFFRTDHHWTQLGAYYAYRALCAEKGVTCAPLSEYESGTYERFVGSMLTYTREYPQSQTLIDHPDRLTYYLPRVKANAKYYLDASLSGGIAVPVVDANLPESAGNKYLCYISGDTPILIVTTAVDGPSCLILKDSYANALVPFLCEHYRKIVIVDPREFNHGDLPKLNLPSFAAAEGIEELLVVNYPFMMNNKSYVSWLAALLD